MGRTDVVSRWQETLQFAVISTPRRLRLSADKDGPDPDRWKPFEYLEIDNRSSAGATIFYALNGRTASSSLATAANPTAQQPQFRLPPKEIDRLFVRATSISVMATSATTVFLTVGRY